MNFLLPINEKLLTKEDIGVSVNRIIESLYWISPLLNPLAGKVEPPTQYKYAGLLAYANGTDWNPISGGEGYYYYSSGAVWVKIG